MARWMAVAVAGMLLAGCSVDNYTNVNPAAGLVDETDVLRAGRFKSKVGQDPGPLFCYQTLGEAECYVEPVPEEHRRLRGYYGTPPELWPYRRPGS
jgi:hypothetical protein